MTVARRRPWIQAAPDHGRLVAAVQLLLLVEVVAFTVSTLPGVRSDRGFHVLLDGWLQGAGYVTTAVLLVLRPVLLHHLRAIWALAAAGLVARALAFVWFLTVVRTEHPVPYPSLSDAGWLAMCVLLLLGLLRLATLSSRALSWNLLLDAVVGATATAAVAIAALRTTVDALTAKGTPTDAAVTNVLYPALDVALLIVVLGVFLAYDWHPPRAVWVAGVGGAGFAVLDTAYLYRIVQGTWHPGTWVSGLSLVSTAAIAFSGWMPPPRPLHRRQRYLPGVLVPGLLAAVCVGVLAWAGIGDVPVASVILAAVGVAAAIARMGLSYRELGARVRLDLDVDGPELRVALDRGQFVLHYQPQISLVDGRVTALEALVRWQHPTRGLLLPEAFLRSIERSGSSRQLTDTVIDQALCQVAQWWEDGNRATVAVNLSVNDLLEEDFPTRLLGALTRYEVPADALVLELTEDLLLADATRGRAVLAQLLEQGVRVHIDDYGIGYSTMSYLRDLPEIAAVKLDRSFITHLDTDQRACAIVTSTIRLARSLGVELVAEGVETVAVRDLLASLGCELAQGYLFARPLPPDQVSFARVVPVPGQR